MKTQADIQYENRWLHVLGKDEVSESNPLTTSSCYCYNCNVGRVDDSGLPYVLTRMIVCPTCGNKRCPHSTDHNLACTNSNEPGQPGSRY